MSDSPCVPYEPRLFRCRACGWTVGESYREPEKRITQLRVYRQAIHKEIGVDFRPIAFAAKYSVIQANDCVVMCDHCGAGTPWLANQTAIEEMLQRRLKLVNRESVKLN